MGFVNLPGYSYTEPVDWHPSTVYRHETHGSASDLNHAPDYVAAPSSSYRGASSGSGLYSEPFPDWSAVGSSGLAAWNCCVYWATRGRSVGGTGVLWSGVCPTTSGGSGFSGGLKGTSYSGGYDEGAGPDIASANADISGWLLSPWKIHAGYNTTMDDSALLDEWSAAVVASYPGDGWELEEEGAPTFLGFAVAPDESTTLPQPYDTEVTVSWLYDPPTGDATCWAYYGFQPSGGSSVETWGSGETPTGELLCTYGGGAADFVAVPPEWQPTPDPDPWVCGFVTPADEDLAAIPLTLTGFEVANNVTSGRENQTLIVRAGWKTPRFRWRRTGAVVPPRRIFQRRDGATHGARGGLLRGTKTVQQSNHTIGGIL